MPLTKKGKKIKRAMIKEYGKKKGEQVFYATENKIRGVRKMAKKKKHKKSAGQVPLHILEDRLKKLNSKVKSRGGKHY